MRNLLIFDCDGTLVNTIVDVALCFNEALVSCGFPTHEVSAYGGFVGGNLETVVSRLLVPDVCTMENIDRVKTVYRRLYLASDKPNTRPYPGMTEALDRLKAAGFLLAVNTNKGQKLTDDLLDKLFGKDYFAAVVGYEETRPSKPDPYGVDMICRLCGSDRNRAVYIGDGKSDIDTAFNAGIPCVLATWGQTTPEDMRDRRAAYHVESAREMEALILSRFGSLT